MGRRHGYWKTHPKAELQSLLMRFHEAGWRIIDPAKGGGYYKVHCVCSLKHKTTIHLSPSNSKYALDKMKWLQRQESSRDSSGGGTA